MSKNANNDVSKDSPIGDLWFYAQVVIKTVSEAISRCCFAEDGRDLFISACRTCSMLIFTRSTNQILNLWRCRRRSRH